MGDDNAMDANNFIDLDLNQHPNPPLPSDEFPATRMMVVDRFRQISGVTARARLHQRRRAGTSSMEITRHSDENLDSDTGVGIGIGIDNSEMVIRTPENGKDCNRKRSHLVAKALEMESEVKKKKADKGDGGSFYDCNICLELAKDPILTCCGHLYCWSCFYRVSDVDSTSKECPVCKGEVSDTTIIPIYGNGDSEAVNETPDGLIIPPRPKARRVESARQQRVTRRMSHVPVAEALRRIRMSIGATGGDTDAPGRQSGEAASARHIRIHQVSRVLSESAASLATLSSALTSAERLVEDLETVINNGAQRSDLPPSPDELANRIIEHSFGSQPVNPDINATLPGSSSLQPTDVSDSSGQGSGRDTLSTFILPPASRYSLRRRNIFLRTQYGSPPDSQGSSRRRRLN
ncbi:uncharacterized protein LOC127243425 [Andrographis paniculata]|uniref:uncharacterized protein LOC127243425 n=1 Tax=Andrographis paniculata TaxID=175694 RepID=UPI0021E8EDD7|nr:uncharacterized protein LOC127243425 [Andrographis paniculata]XP_051119511.1 uncharacterized protein LOC127243425 [Andrographis paniculata]